MGKMIFSTLMAMLLTIYLLREGMAWSSWLENKGNMNFEY